jgi:hypothetical protein
MISGAASADSLLMRSPLRRELVRTLKKSQGLDKRPHRRRSGDQEEFYIFSPELRVSWKTLYVCC